MRADKTARKGLIAFGVVIWSLATVASGLAPGFWSLLAARIVCGVGEASFVVLAPTIIDDVMPPEKKGKALSLFFLAIPLGSAIGYLVGGYAANRWGWRNAFLLVGGPGIVLALACLLIAEPARKLLDAKASVMSGLREIGQVPLFRRAVFGYAAFTAAVGAFSFWAPKYLVERFPGQLNVKTANFWFGVVLLAAGTVGTLVGGWWADREIRKLAQPTPAHCMTRPRTRPRSTRSSGSAPSGW